MFEKEKKRKIVSMMYAHIKHKKRKKKNKRKSTYAYESTKAIHVTIKVLYAHDMKIKVM